MQNSLWVHEIHAVLLLSKNIPLHKGSSVMQQA